MNWGTVARRVSAACTHRRIELPEGTVLTPDKPIEGQALAKALLAGAETKEDRRRVRGEEPREVMFWFEDPAPLEEVLGFSWQLDSMLGSGVSLSLLDAGDRRVLFVDSPATLEFRAVAAVAPSAQPRVLSAFARDALGREGAIGSLFGSLPAQVVNRRPDLIDAEAVREGCREWVRSSGGIFSDGCESVQEAAAREVADPAQLARVLEAIPGLTAEHVKRVLRLDLDEDDDLWNDDLSEDDQRLLFELYFVLTYRTPPRRNR
jgi:hypothetical protein